MAEFVGKRCEDMIPELEQMERSKLFDKNEIRSIAKKLTEYEYKIHRHTKCKEDYLKYIQYEMDLLKLIKQRRDKYGITQKKSEIDFAIANKIDNLYKDAILRFQDDIRFWIAYIKFCKYVQFQSNINRMLSRMLQVHRNKPKCWHIAARWEIEENNNKKDAGKYLLRGLHIHPDSQLLYVDAFRLELDDHIIPNNTENTENRETTTTDENEMSLALKRAYVIYQEASKYVKDIKFIVELLNVTQEYKNTEILQKKIISDMVREYSHEPLMWDTMARRELRGLVQPNITDTPMELDNTVQTTSRDRISACNKVYQTAVKKIKNEEMWSFYMECLLEINQDLSSLPNFKKKLLKTALAQGHQAKKLREKYYLHWASMLSTDKEESRKKLSQVLCGATDAIPSSVNLWYARTRHLLLSGQEKEAETIFSKATEILGEKSLSLWKMWILHVQTKNSEKTEATFRAALQAHPIIARDIKPTYIEWLVLTKNIYAARKAYENLCLQPPTSLEFHKKMAALELMQPEVSLKHARRPYEMAALQFGSNNTSVWMDYVKFEIKHGEPKKIADIHTRAVKTLERNLTYSFITEYSLMTAKSSSMIT